MEVSNHRVRFCPDSAGGTPRKISLNGGRNTIFNGPRATFSATEWWERIPAAEEAHHSWRMFPKRDRTKRTRPLDFLHGTGKRRRTPLPAFIPAARRKRPGGRVTSADPGMEYRAPVSRRVPGTVPIMFQMSYNGTDTSGTSASNLCARVPKYQANKSC